MQRLTRFFPALGVLFLEAAVCAQGGAPARPWDPQKYGSHRAVVRVDGPDDAVRVRIDWRRRDFRPEEKNIIVVDAGTGARVTDVFRVSVTRESGELVFRPATTPGDYHIYYMPWVSSGRSNYPTVTYPPPEDTARPEWLAAHGLAPGLLPGRAREKLPSARFVGIESVDPFHSFDPMEFIATAAETRQLVSQHPGAGFLLFPEDRDHPIRMSDDLPRRWAERGAGGEFRAEAARGEFLSFQLGLFAAARELRDVRVKFAELRGPAAVIPASAFRCFNTGGVDSTGRGFTKRVSVPAGKVQALWMGLHVPRDQAPGEYSGTVTVSAAGTEPRSVLLRVTVSAVVLEDSGDSEPSRMARLRWLDSTLAQDDAVVAPFEPVQAHGGVVTCLGRTVKLGTLGLPDRIESLFAPEMTHLQAAGRELLAGPVSFVAMAGAGRTLEWRAAGPKIVRRAEGVAQWEAAGRADPVELSLRAGFEFDGNIEYEITVRTRRAIDLQDMRLEIPLRRDVARYIMGLGVKGGVRPAEVRWKWDATKNQDSVWVGDVNAGLQLSLKDDNYVRPLNTNFYLLKPLNMPPSWFNGGRGGIDIADGPGGSCLVRAYSGPRTLSPGAPLHFNFRLALTPFKTIDTRGQWSTRYYHRFAPVAEIASKGANTINVHHANAINPYINYPFLRPREMKAYVDEAHRHGMKVKIYYTVRELSNRAAELFALRSLGDEVFLPGPGGGFSWLQEHLGADYINGWFVPELEDAAVINSGVSRWHNYYVEGLSWLARNVGIDGLYIDDVAFDRVTMKRVRKVLDRNRPGALIDLHSANQFNPRDGFANSANLYLEHFPYIDRLWFGEYFDYDSPPDFWLVELSGIPFGLMGEMLQGGGNPWRGMLFGMTARLPWAGDPTGLWKVWDDFGIADSRMSGWWAPSTPVKTGRPDVLATTYARKGQALVALASWARETAACRLQIDWTALGINPGNADLRAPAIPGFQEATAFRAGEEIAVQPGRGWLIIIRGRN